MTTKDKVLEILSQNHNQSVSGEKIAQFCGVSRAAIWKAIKTLREEGCQIKEQQMVDIYYKGRQMFSQKIC